MPGDIRPGGGRLAGGGVGEDGDMDGFPFDGAGEDSLEAVPPLSLRFSCYLMKQLVAFHTVAEEPKGTNHKDTPRALTLSMYRYSTNIA